MVQNKVKIDPRMIEWFKAIIASCPNPEISSVKDFPSPKRMLECLLESAMTKKLVTEEQRLSYQAVKNQYDFEVAKGYMPQKQK